MKKVININFQGRVVMIEEVAYENLKQYIDSLRVYFANEEGRDEIINDIEWRISELFEEIIKKGEPCVTEVHLESIIKSIGRPQELQQEEDIYQAHAAATTASATASAESAQENTYTKATPAQDHTRIKKRLHRDETNKKIGGVCAGVANYLGIDHTLVRIVTVLLAFAYGISVLIYIILWAALPGAATKEIGSSYKKLYRDPSNKMLGGICAGLSHYFNVELWVVRLIFLLSLLSPAILGILDFGFVTGSLSGFTALLYLVLWIVVPKAKRPSDFLAMRGENIDLTNIRNTVQEDMGDDKKKVNKPVITDTDNANNAEINSLMNQPQPYTYQESGSTLGDILLTIIKIFAYTILGILLLTLLSVLIALGTASFFTLPYLNLYFNEGWQNIASVIAIVCFIWVPVIALCIWLIRRIFGYKHKNSNLRNAFLMLWVVGLIASVALLISGINNIKYESELSRQTVALNNPGVNKMIVDFKNDNSKKLFFKKGIRLFPFKRNDKFYINNMYLDIEKSTDSNYHAYIQKYANGTSIADANAWADKINLPFTQQDSVLHIDKGILINADNKFRNQKANITIEVPIGKTILINDNYFGSPNVEIGNFRWRRNRDWSTGKEYIMTAEGLKPLHEENADVAASSNDGEGDVSVKKEIENGVASYYINDEPVDSLTYEDALKKIQTKKDSTANN